MQSLLGTFLRELRRSRRLSQSQAASAAGIGRVTLNRWERGVQQPRELDLQSLLSALSADARQRRQALAMLKAPQTRAQTRNLIVRIGEQKGIGPMPHGGDLLRALRKRRGLSQEEAAPRIGVTVRTLRRWERLESWPSLTQLHALCYALEAQTEEMLALTTGKLSSAPEAGTASAEPASLHELRARGHQLFFYTIGGQGEVLKELRFLTLEAQVWPHAARSEAGRQVLSHLYSYHAQHLARYQRFAESGTYAHRALDLLPQGAPPDTIGVMAGITAAQSEVHRGPRPAPQRGLEMLHHWTEAARWPEYKAWLLSDTASYLVQVGDVPSGLQVAHQASAIAAGCENLSELYNRELNEARLLLQAGKPEASLMLSQRDRRGLHAQFRLLEVAAYLSLKDSSLAHDRLQEAWRLIEDGGLVHLQPQAQKLALRF